MVSTVGGVKNTCRLSNMDKYSWSSWPKEAFLGFCCCPHRANCVSRSNRRVYSNRIGTSGRGLGFRASSISETMSTRLFSDRRVRADGTSRGFLSRSLLTGRAGESFPRPPRTFFPGRPAIPSLPLSTSVSATEEVCTEQEKRWQLWWWCACMRVAGAVIWCHELRVKAALEVE